MPYAGSEGVIPASSCRSCGSIPQDSKVAAVPSTRKRGAGSPVTMFIERRDRTPEACSSETNASSSASASRGSECREVSPYTSTAGPKSCSAWSMRCGPRSASRPPPSAIVAVPFHERRPAGFHESKRDSRRTTSPSAPSARRRRTVRKSESQRRFWKTVSTRPAVRAFESRASPSATVGTKGLSTTTCSPASSAASARARWVDGGVPMTTRSRSAAPANSSSVVGTTRAVGWSWVASAARSGSPVTMASRE